MFDKLNAYISCGQSVLYNINYMEESAKGTLERFADKKEEELDSYDKSAINEAKITLEMLDAIKDTIKKMVKSAI